MKRSRWAIMAGLFLVSAAASFVLTMWPGRSTASANDALALWLGMTPEQMTAVAEDDPDFAEESARLRADLNSAETALASMLEDPAKSGEAIIAQVKRVGEARSALELRVARHVVAVRHHLTPEQQRRLMGLCAEGVRQGMGRGWRGGRGQGGGMGPGGGVGPGGGRRQGGRTGDE